MEATNFDTTHPLVSDRDTYHSFDPIKTRRQVARFNNYSIYYDDKTQKTYVDIVGKKNPTKNSYFWEVQNMNVACQLIELIAVPVRD